MKSTIVALCVAVSGLLSFGSPQDETSDTSRPSSEQVLLQEATTLAAGGRFEEAWRLLLTSEEETRTLAPAKLGWRTSTVAGSLRNQSYHVEADAFARFALMQPWFEKGAQPNRREMAVVAYWCAWLASEIIEDRRTAVEWIEQAHSADPESEMIEQLRKRVTAAHDALPRN
jgi:hypothetical protein